MKIAPVALAKRVEKWQKELVELGLAHWRIEKVILTDEMPNEGDADASVFASQQYDSFVVWFRNDFIAETTSVRLDETIVHELLHVWMRDMDEAISAADDFLSAASLSIWQERVNHEREGMIEALARLIVRLKRGEKPRFTP